MTKEALKLALETLENHSGNYKLSKAECVKYQAVEAAIKEALAQPEQEPVQWGVDWGKDGNSVSIVKRLADGNIEVLAWEYAPHPQQRTWVGLTDEERKEIALEVPMDAVCITEAKLKEKNT